MQTLPDILIYESVEFAAGQPRFVACIWARARGEAIPCHLTGSTITSISLPLGGQNTIGYYECKRAPMEKLRYMSCFLTPGALLFSGETAEAASTALKSWWTAVRSARDREEGEPQVSTSKAVDTSPRAPTASSGIDIIWDQVHAALLSKSYASQQEIATALQTTQGKVSQLMIKADKNGFMSRDMMQAIFKEVRAARR